MKHESENDKLRNLRFKAQFAESNLLWLAGEPATDETRRLQEFNRAVIRDAQTQIAELEDPTR